MSELKGWLSLKVQDKPRSGNDLHKALLLVSIPKKIVRLATRRNRLKRLLREAFRKESRLEPEKAYLFRVMQNPGDLGLKETKNIMNGLISSLNS